MIYNLKGFDGVCGFHLIFDLFPWVWPIPCECRNKSIFVFLSFSMICLGLTVERIVPEQISILMTFRTSEGDMFAIYYLAPFFILVFQVYGS
jgi:hypothetical protein